MNSPVTTRSIPWPRILVEGVVIVGSILLAFGIDAWWDGVQERALELEYAERLRADLVQDAGTELSYAHPGGGGRA